MFKWCDQRLVGNYLTTVPPTYFFMIWIKYVLSLHLAIKQLFKISQIFCPPQIIEYTGASLNVSQSKFNYYKVLGIISVFTENKMLCQWLSQNKGIKSNNPIRNCSILKNKWKLSGWSWKSWKSLSICQRRSKICHIRR